MSALVLPPIVQYNEERARLTERHDALRWFDAQLRELDPNLSLVKASESAVDRDLTPGYWHIRRSNPIGLDTYMRVTGPNGEFMEPHSGVLDRLRQADLQRSGGWEELLAKVEREENESRRRQDAVRAEIREEFLERYKAKANPSVSFSRRKGA